MSAVEPLEPADSLRDWEVVTRAAVDARLAALLSASASASPLLKDAAEMACLGRGKRVRPVLAMLAADHFGQGGAEAALDFGCAVEMAHCASLVLDDLPCMDDASTRRGQPTLHRSFDEATAVLTAVALLNEAYAVIAALPGQSAERKVLLQRLLAAAIGFSGLAAGQARDLFEEEELRDEASLASLNHQKTGVLFVAVLQGGAAIAGAGEAAQQSVAAFARCVGLAFQILDDLNDATSTVQAIGKDAGQDAGRTTFVALWGVERCRRRVNELLDEALAELGSSEAPLARYVMGLFSQAGRRSPG